MPCCHLYTPHPFFSNFGACFSVVDHKLCSPRTRVQRIQCHVGSFARVDLEDYPKQDNLWVFFLNFASIMCSISTFCFFNYAWEVWWRTFFISQMWLWLFWAQICGELWWEVNQRVQAGTHFFVLSFCYNLLSLFSILTQQKNTMFCCCFICGSICTY